LLVAGYWLLPIKFVEKRGGLLDCRDLKKGALGSISQFPNFLLGVVTSRDSKFPNKKSPPVETGRPLTIACHMKKKFKY